MSITKKRGSIDLARQLGYQINGAVYDSDDMEGSGYGSVDIAEILSAEVVRLQEALAQPEQEPFGYFKAEPFGWTDCAESDIGAIALYQTPPRRTWVGLTDDEISELSKGHIVRSTYARAIEAKLKEKNA